MTALNEHEVAFLQRLLDTEIGYCENLMQSTWDEEAIADTESWLKELRTISAKLNIAPQPQVGR